MFKMLFKYRLSWILAVLLLALTTTIMNMPPVVAQSTVRILNIGDSRMDEYYPPAEDAPSRDGCPASLPGCLSLSWVEQLAYLRGNQVNYGAYGNWSDARRHGLAYNLALSGVAYEGQSDIANTNFYGTLNMIFAQEPAFDIIFVGLGANDFATYRADGYQEVANGSVTPQQKIDKILASFNTLMAAVRAKAPTTPVRVHLITPNLIDSIAAGLGYTPTQRNLVMQAMVGVNNGMMAYDASDPYTQALDFETAFHAPYIGLGADGYWNYLGYHINFFQACDDPRICGSVEPASAPHPSIWGEGMIANWHLAVIAQTLGINIPPLTDAEMLQLAGLSAVPTPTATPVVPTATLTNTPAPTITPTVIPQEAAYIRIHIVGQTDQIIPLPPTYERVTGFCSGNANYIGIQEPGVSFRKYVCWS